MGQKKFRLKGHETFMLREGWLTKGLFAVRENPNIFSVHYGADTLGVGSNMAKAIRYWLRESGLIEENTRKGAKLTPLGELVYQYDPYFERVQTLWLLHINLSLNAEHVTSWYLFFNQIADEDFTTDELFHWMQMQLCEYASISKEDFSERSLRDDITVLCNMYCENTQMQNDPEDKAKSPFARLGLLRKHMNKYSKVQPNLEQFDVKILLYILCVYAAKYNQDAIRIDEIVEKSELVGCLCNMGRVAVNQLLDILAGQMRLYGTTYEPYITVNRTAGLDMVYINHILSKEDIIRDIYLTKGEHSSI